MDFSRRELGLLGGLGFIAAGVPAAADAAVASMTADPASYVHPEYRQMLPALQAAAAAAAASPSVPAAEPAQHSPLLPAPMTSPAWVKRSIPGPKGAPDVGVCIVNAGGRDRPRPAILHMHGGGFVALSAEAFLYRLQEVATAVDCVIVSVDYRLAPATRFPGSLEDNYAALKWLHAHALELGADPGRIAVMGESAGGGHAAMLAIAARDRGEFHLVYQSLSYPMLDDRTGSTRMPPPQIGAFIWGPAQNRNGWAALLGQPAGARKVPYGSVPARVEDLRNLPPAFINVGSIDLFVEEDMTYARRLTEASVPVELHVYPGCFHAFDLLPVQTRVAAAAKSALYQGLRLAFGSTA